LSQRTYSADNIGESDYHRNNERKYNEWDSYSSINTSFYFQIIFILFFIFLFIKMDIIIKYANKIIF